MANLQQSVICLGAIDSAGKSGLSADIRAATLLGGHIFPLVTACTVQGSQGVMATAPTDISLLEKQWHQTVKQWPEEQEVVVKIGALVQPSILTALPQWLDAVTSGVKLVVDPVLSASAGGRLQPEGYAAWLHKMAPRITVLTPNLLEAQALLGADLNGTDAQAWQRLGFNGVLLKGGHGDDAHVVEDCWLQAGEHRFTFSHQRLAGNRRGTGCFLATAIACQLALGKNENRAISDAISSLLQCWHALPRDTE